MEEKTFTIRKHRRGKTTDVTGTLAYLTDYFAYTLEAGHSYDSKVSLKPRTARTLVSALNRAVDSLQKGSYDPNYYELVVSSLVCPVCDGTGEVVPLDENFERSGEPEPCVDCRGGKVADPFASPLDAR